ncbi:hypothetical protein D9M68_713400 [compost metagenome]
MRQRVHASGCGDLRRQTDAQFGIQNHQRGEHPGVEDDAFDMCDIVGYHRGATDFRAGACGGRYRDYRRHASDIDAIAVVTDVLEVPQWAALADHQGNGLAGIQRRAAAEGDHPVVAAGLEGGDAVGDVLPGGIALDRREQCGLEAVVAALQQRLVDHRQGGQTGVGDQQRRTHTQCPAGFGQLDDAPGTDADRGRVVPVHAVLFQVHGAPHNWVLKWKDFGRVRCS